MQFPRWGWWPTHMVSHMSKSLSRAGEDFLWCKHTYSGIPTMYGFIAVHFSRRTKLCRHNAGQRFPNPIRWYNYSPPHARTSLWRIIVFQNISSSQPAVFVPMTSISFSVLPHMHDCQKQGFVCFRWDGKLIMAPVSLMNRRADVNCLLALFWKPGIQRVVFREAKTYHVAGYAGPVWYIGSYPHVGLQRY